MQHSPRPKANSLSHNQKFSRIVWKPKIYLKQLRQPTFQRGEKT